MSAAQCHHACQAGALRPRRARFYRGAGIGRAWPALGLLGLLGGSPAHAEVTEEFHIGEVDLGAIPHIGDFDWRDTLEYRWDTNFSFGGIVGKPNATVTPRIEIPIPFLPNIVIPAVTADTRTGARFSGNIAGGIGLDFFADFSASGLATDNLFDLGVTGRPLP